MTLACTTTQQIFHHWIRNYERTLWQANTKLNSKQNPTEACQCIVYYNQITLACEIATLTPAYPKTRASNVELRRYGTSGKRKDNMSPATCDVPSSDPWVQPPRKTRWLIDVRGFHLTEGASMNTVSSKSWYGGWHWDSRQSQVHDFMCCWYRSYLALYILQST